MGYKPKYYDFKDMKEYIHNNDLSLQVQEQKNGGKLSRIIITSDYARKPIVIEEMSSGLYCVYEQHKYSKRHISIHKTHKGVLGRVNQLIDRYCETSSKDDIKKAN